MNNSRVENSDSLRFARTVLAVSWITSAWLLFLWTHETGHILGAIFTGGHIDQVVLHPLAFSRTDVSPNPSPRLVVWSGACIGILVAFMAFMPLRFIPKHGRILYRSMLGFVLIANGCYIGLGVIEPVGDTNVMLGLGAPKWALGLFGIIACGLGFRLWGGINPMRMIPVSGVFSIWRTTAILSGLVLTLGFIGMACCSGG